MRRVVKTIFKLRRGHTDTLAEKNITPQDGEPVFDLDLGRLKIGDGNTPYNDLAYIGEESIYNSKTSSEFPSTGESNILYKAEEENKLYQWDTEKLQYVELTISPKDIESLLSEIKIFADKKTRSFVFDTKEHLDQWMDGTYTREDEATKEDLKPGDLLLLEQEGIPDCYWNGNSIVEIESSSIFGIGNEVVSNAHSLIVGDRNQVKHDESKSIIAGNLNTANKYQNTIFGDRNTLNSIHSMCSGTLNVSNDGVGYVTLLGQGLIGYLNFQTVLGRYNNNRDKRFDPCLVVGGGNSDTNRKDLLALRRYTGDLWVNGKVLVGGTDTGHTDAKELATKEYTGITEVDSFDLTYKSKPGIYRATSSFDMKVNGAALSNFKIANGSLFIVKSQYNNYTNQSNIILSSFGLTRSQHDDFYNNIIYSWSVDYLPSGPNYTTSYEIVKYITTSDIDQTYKSTSSNPASGKAVAGAVKTLIGTNIGNPAADTIWGAKNYADAVVGTAKNTLIGSDSDTGDSNTIKGAKKYTDSQIQDVNSSISNINTNLEFINNDLSTKQDKLEFNTAYNASTNKVATMADVTNAIDQSYNPESANAQSGVAVSQAISNKVDKVEGKGLSTNDFTEEYKSKLDGIESGAKVNVQSDWNQEDTSADDYIKNKPVVDQNYDPTSSNAQSGIAIASVIGDIETALDSIIAMQNSYIGGNS